MDRRHFLKIAAAAGLLPFPIWSKAKPQAGVDLTPFLANGLWETQYGRWAIHRTWTFEGWTYATNSYIAVRVPTNRPNDCRITRDDETRLETKHKPELISLVHADQRAPRLHTLTGWDACRSANAAFNTQRWEYSDDCCPDCDGVLDYSSDNDCPTCGGRGMVIRPYTCAIAPGVRLGRWSVEKLNTLTGIRLGKPITVASDTCPGFAAIPFRFDGGEGVATTCETFPISDPSYQTIHR